MSKGLKKPNTMARRLADRLSAERRKVARPVGMGAVLERLVEHGRSESKQLELGGGCPTK